MKITVEFHFEEFPQGVDDWILDNVPMVPAESVSSER